MSALSRVSGFVPSLRSVFLSGRFRLAPWAGAALGLSFRRSRLSLSGFVAVVRFSSFPAALRFARCWGRRLPARPGFCAVRRVPGGFAVSVPVCPCLPPCRSGLRALLAVRAAAALACSGWPLLARFRFLPPSGWWRCALLRARLRRFSQSRLRFLRIRASFFSGFFLEKSGFSAALYFLIIR